MLQRLRRKEMTTSVVPLALTLAYSSFVAVHLWVNWRTYGPFNFLWCCDIAVLTTLVALWWESRLLISIASIAILVPLMLWGVDLAVHVAIGHYLFGFAGYMFDQRVPLDVRLISTFHVWLPFVLIWTLCRLGYDRRAFVIQSVFIAILLITSRMLSAAPPRHSLHESVNINWAYGTSDDAPQSAMPWPLYLGLMIVLYPLVIYLPTHLVLSALMAEKRSHVSAPRFGSMQPGRCPA
jgi:hypothetical protein